MGEWTGGCLCGAVRYRLDSEPFDTGWCHCRKCQLSSGSPAMLFSTVPVGDYVTTEGQSQVHQVQSSTFGRRTFCGNCGTPLTMRVDHQPDTTDFTVATLDEPERLRPGFHIFWASRLSSIDGEDDLPKFERFRPDTRGLEGTEPPA